MAIDNRSCDKCVNIFYGDGSDIKQNTDRIMETMNFIF